jgi:hypothetical protein
MHHQCGSIWASSMWIVMCMYKYTHTRGAGKLQHVFAMVCMAGPCELCGTTYMMLSQSNPTTLDPPWTVCRHVCKQNS